MVFFFFLVKDKVRIRRDLEVGERYGTKAFTKNMEQFKGKVVAITHVSDIYKTYEIKEDNMFFSWTDEMFECKVYDDLDEFWDDWKNEKVCIKFNNSNDFNKFIDYHFKHFNITCPNPNIEYFDSTKYVAYYTLMPDKWGLVNNNKITDYNVITYDDFIKLVEKEKSKNLEESINNVGKIVESTNSPKIDEWDKNVPAENTDGMGTFESEISNKNHILMEQRIENLEKLIIKDGIELNIKKILQKLLNENLNVKEYNEYLDIIERLLNIKNK